jgi:hypothetical protein
MHWLVDFCCKGWERCGFFRGGPALDSGSLDKLCLNQCVPVRGALAGPAAVWCLSTGRCRWTGAHWDDSTNMQDLPIGQDQLVMLFVQCVADARLRGTAENVVVVFKGYLTTWAEPDRGIVRLRELEFLGVGGLPAVDKREPLVQASPFEPVNP